MCQQPIEALLGKNNLDAFFDTRGAKKALQRNAVFVGRRPTPRKPLKRLDPNFAALVLAKPFDKSKFEVAPNWLLAFLVFYFTIKVSKMQEKSKNIQ